MLLVSYVLTGNLPAVT